MEFLEWLLIESFELEYGPKAEPISLKRDHASRPLESPDHHKFKEFCRQILISYFGTHYKNAISRYKFIIDKISEGFSEVNISFKIVPKVITQMN
jgi:hypothetical protein